jgi:hypothetical protein
MKIFKWICLIIWWLLFMFTAINLLQSDINEWKSLKPLRELIFISQNAMETTRPIVKKSINRKIIPKPHPFINSNSWKENNNTMHKYLTNYMYDLSTTYTWDFLIRFTTTNKVSDNRDIFFAINWKTIGRIDKNKQTEKVWHRSFDDTKQIPIIWNNWYKFNVDISTWVNNINAFVWENNNRIEEIYLYSY